MMRQMQQQVQHLADLSVNNLGLSSFAATVRQVSFNAWHYSDDQLWTGLIEHLFRELASPAEAASTDTAPADAEEQRRMRASLDDLRARDEYLTARLSVFGSVQPKGWFSRLGSPAASARLILLGVRELARDIRTYGWLLAAWALVGAGAYFITWLVQDQVGWLVAQIGAVAAPFLAAWQRLRCWRRRSGSLTNQVRAKLEQRRRQIRKGTTELLARLAEVDAAVRLSEFLGDRSRPSTYQQYRGLLGQVHRDLKQLDADLRAAHRQWDASPTQTPPLERIILYIDDLDRCPPQRVVKVLAAVHLMLALPLFVVVVAVDPRWLLSSLHHHYQELFTDAGPTERSWGEDLATPLDYLDKIFQIPFAVAPLSDTAASGYLNALLQPNRPSTTTTIKPDHHDKPYPASPMPATQIPDADEPDPGEHTDTDRVEQPAPATRDDLQEEKPAPAEPARVTAPSGGGPTTVPDLRPQGLQMSAEEVDFLARLGRLLPTPRAAKKLVNLYRLIRIGIHDTHLPTYLAERTYQPLQLLLALLVGIPHDARIILTAILAAEPTDDFIKLLGADTTPSVSNKDWTTTEQTRRRLTDLLESLRVEMSAAPPPTAIEAYQQWCPEIARYSFHTRTLAEPRHRNRTDKQ
jgi:hypothetical protein